MDLHQNKVKKTGVIKRTRARDLEKGCAAFCFVLISSWTRKMRDNLWQYFFFSHYLCRRSHNARENGVLVPQNEWNCIKTKWTRPHFSKHASPELGNGLCCFCFVCLYVFATSNCATIFGSFFVLHISLGEKGCWYQTMHASTWKQMCGPRAVKKTRAWVLEKNCTQIVL